MTGERLTSVVIVTYFTGPALGQVIDSVLAQTADVELILVNNGNPPDVEENLVNRFKDEPLVRLMTGHGNIGLGRANNLGARVAKGSHILFLGPTTKLEPDTITRLYEHEAVIKRPYVIGPRIVGMGGQELLISRRVFSTPQNVLIRAFKLESFFPKKCLLLHQEPLPKKMMAIPSLSHSFMFMAKDDFVAAQGFGDRFIADHEDMAFCLRFRRRGGGIYFAPDITVTKHDDPNRPYDYAYELARTKDAIHYLGDFFGDSTFQPLLWFVYGTLWVSFGIKALRAGHLPILNKKMR